MDSHPSCRRPHKLPAHTVKELREWPQRRPRVLRSFLRSEPPIVAGFSFPSTPLSRRRPPLPLLRPEGLCRSEPLIIADFLTLSTAPFIREPDIPSKPASEPLRTEPPIVGRFLESSTTLFQKSLIRAPFRCCSFLQGRPSSTRAAQFNWIAEFVNHFLQCPHGRHPGR